MDGHPVLLRGGRGTFRVAAKQSATMSDRDRDSESEREREGDKARTVAHYALLLFLSIEIQ